jgi:photosystem II stability/assembly factor-like uncharacterized protein
MKRGLFALTVILMTGTAMPVAGTQAASAESVKVQAPRAISLPSPFSGPCTRAIPSFTPGIAEETSVAVNPRDPRQILVSWIQDGRASDLVMASHDGGRSFSRILIPGLSACTGGEAQVASDPGVAFAADGSVAYFSGVVASGLSETSFAPSSSMVVSRSFDGGVSWSVPSVIQPPTGVYWDKPILSVDPGQPARAFYTYDLRIAPDFTSGYSLLSTTTDGGQTWSAPQKLYDPHTSDSWPANSEILVNRDGSLLDIFLLASKSGAGPAQVLAIRSVDGGQTWDEPIEIGRSSGEEVNDPVSQNILQTIDALPSQTVAPNGDVYVSWTQPGATNASSRIAVARSSDGGRHWRMSPLTVRGQAALPAIAVAGDGTVGLLHYVVAPSSRNGVWPAQVMLATSRDRAEHWSSRAVADPFNLLTAATVPAYRGCCVLGDYVGMSRLPHGFAAAFPMAKPFAANAIDVYFTRITTSRGGG